MGSRSSKLDSQQHLQVGRHVEAPPLQDDALFNSLYKPELFASAVSKSWSPYESSNDSFPNELPERPIKLSRFSFTKGRAPLSTLASASTPVFSKPPPVSASVSDINSTKEVELQPYRSTDHTSTLPAPAAAPLPSVRPRRKPLPASNISHDLRTSISSAALSAPEHVCRVKTSGVILSPRTNADLPVDPALDLRLVKLRSRRSSTNTSQQYIPTLPSSPSIQEENFLFSSVPESNSMAGPIRKPRRLLKEDARPSLNITQKQAPKRDCPTQSGQVDDVSLHYDSDDTPSPPRKSRRNHRAQSEGLIEKVTYPDIAARDSEKSRSRTVSAPVKSELDEDNGDGTSIGVPKRPETDSSSPMRMDEDEWQHFIVTRQLQQAENHVMLENQAMPVPGRSAQGIKKGRNHPVSTENRIRTSPWGPANRISPGTKEEPIELSSDSEPDLVETDSMYARRLDQEFYDELVKSKSRQIQQQVHDAAIAQKLEQEQRDEERRQEEEVERERLRVEEEQREELRREEEERERKRYRDCAVCGEKLLRANFPSLAYCTHEPETCAECYASWITSEIKDGSWREIKCPGNKCMVVLENHEIQQFATSEDFDQLGNLLLRDALSTDPNFRWCRGPGCQSGHVHEGGNNDNIWRCGECGFRVCVIHDNTWHEGETCTEYDYRVTGQKEKNEQKRKEQEEASLQAIGKLSKRCPGKECGWNIQKNEGCDHMTCSKCRHEFCWVCLAPYGPIRMSGNAAHNDDCKYHSSRIR